MCVPKKSPRSGARGVDEGEDAVEDVAGHLRGGRGSLEEVAGGMLHTPIWTLSAGVGYAGG
jgi:hypothetical protein